MAAHLTTRFLNERAMSDIKNQFNHSTLNEPKFIYGGKTINKYLGAIPFIPEVFHGREDELTTIHDKLFNGNNLLLLVNGEGGIGKTTIASKYYQAYQAEYSHLAWVFAEKNLRDAMLTLAYPLQITFPEMMTEDERLQALLCEMAELNKPSLLIIDNANSLDDLASHYHVLKACPNFHLLLTTRITAFQHAETYAIKPLDEKSAMRLFTTHYPDHNPEENNLLHQILEAVGYNTLVIEVLAKNLGNFNNRLRKRYTLPDLLGDLQKRGLFGLSKSDTISTAYKGDGHGLHPEKPETILAEMYNLSELEEEEKAMLSVLSLLPAEPIAFSTLEELLPGVDNLDRTLLSLAKKGWLEYNETTSSFKCSPVVQEVTHLQNREKLIEHCELLINTLTEKLDYEPGTGHLPNVSYDKGALYARYGERITSIALILPLRGEKILLLLDCIGTYHKTTGNLDKALTLFDERSRLSKELYDDYQQNVSFKNGLAISYSKLGETHSALGNLDKALTFFDDETRLFIELYDDYQQNVSFKNGLAISYEKLGETHSALGNLDKALTFFEQDTQLSKELYDDYPQNVSFKNGLAISYEKLGETHSALGNLDKALTFFDDETRLFKELY
jgi:tetratricopeptide (TPR) repeat protein